MGEQPAAFSDTVTDVCSRLIAYGLPVLFFLITVAFYLRTYDSAQIKITLLQIGGTALIMIWLTKLVLERTWPISRHDLVVIAPFLAFLASGIISYIRSPFHGMSFDEFLRRIYYISLALMVITEFRSKERLIRLSRWLIAATVVVTVYGLIQYLDGRLFPPKPEPGLDPFIWRGAFATRIFSSFGNPNFFGNFLVLIMPFVFAQYLRFGGRPARPFIMIIMVSVLWWLTDKIFIGLNGGVPAGYGFWYQSLLMIVLAGTGIVMIKGMPGVNASLSLGLFGLIFLNLLSTETKGAWIGFMGALAATSGLIAWYFLQKARLVRRVIYGLLLAFLIAGIAFVGVYTKKRMTSVKFRVFTWIATWEMIHTHPVLGTGIGSFKVSYPAYRRPEIITLEAKSNTETDHVEDEYLETWYDEGIIGFGILIWLILSVSCAGLRNLKKLTNQQAVGGGNEGGGIAGNKDPAAYQLLGYLAAFWGALLHWCFDVSVRFVSSGIYFGLLPAGVVAINRHYPLPETQDRPWPYQRWIHLSWPAFWLVIFLSLKMQPVAVLICCAALWLISNGLDFGITPDADFASDSEETGRITVNEGKQPALKSLLKAATVFIVISAGCYAIQIGRGFFMADVNHNLAIFFSKEAIWAKLPEYDAKASGMGPEMKEEYDKVGGALEHYVLVNKLNPFFPMALYFVGNVHNDWGSQLEQQSQQARARGDIVQAGILRKQAIEHWKLALDSYDHTKQLAPNYVQTHHQVGLVYNKFAEQANAWGEGNTAQDYFNKALDSFGKYRYLDPVFPPNQYRMAAIYVQRRQYAEAEDCYRQAIYYNDVVVRRIYPEGFKDRLGEAYLNLGKLNYFRAMETQTQSPGSLQPGVANENRIALLKASEDSFRQAIINQPKYLDAIKALAILLGRTGRVEESLQYWRQAHDIAPQDPDVQTIFSSATNKK